MQRVPILKIGDVLLVSIQIDLQDQTVLGLQEDLADRIVATSAHGVIIDITAVDIVDSFIGRMFATIAAMSRLMDAETVVVGMRPAVAITLVELGLSLGGVRTALDLEEGMRLLGAEVPSSGPGPVGADAP
ncbi:MAG: STAS domain-containing protein [Spirillospora sp.]